MGRCGSMWVDVGRCGPPACHLSVLLSAAFCITYQTAGGRWGSVWVSSGFRLSSSIPRGAPVAGVNGPCGQRGGSVFQHGLTVDATARPKSCSTGACNRTIFYIKFVITCGT